MAPDLPSIVILIITLRLVEKFLCLHTLIVNVVDKYAQSCFKLVHFWDVTPYSLVNVY
jgi:hypothetical protein